MRVGLFDSGLGGLTVLKAFLKYHPNNEYIYCGDNLNVPYGDKSKDELLKLSTNIIKFLESKNVDIIIIACGTVSSNIYDDLKQISNVPIYNVLDETINYINSKNYRKTLVIATTATINSHVFKTKINNHIIELPTPKLVPLIENNASVDIVLKDYFNDLDFDSIILGCTHYPIIKSNIEKIISKNVDIIDMGEIFAQNINLTDSKQNVTFYFTKQTKNLNEKIRKIVY